MAIQFRGPIRGHVILAQILDHCAPWLDVVSQCCDTVALAQCHPRRLFFQPCGGVPGHRPDRTALAKTALSGHPTTRHCHCGGATWM